VGKFRNETLVLLLTCSVEQTPKVYRTL